LLTFEQIKELIELVSTHQLHGVEIERSGFRLKIDGHSPAPVVAALPAGSAGIAPAAPATPATPAGTIAAPPAVPSGEAAAAPGSAPAAGAGAHILNSPIVGTFYRAPSPDADAFVEVGSRVKKGQVVCIIEAMKLMNEIESDADGVVAEIFPQNAQAVEFGEPLFAIRTS
jgi:acetyl-CoA carboxylase biotin carboxyl carrier protein